MDKPKKLRPGAPDDETTQHTVARPNFPSCVYVVRPGRQSKAAPKSSPFTNAPMQTGGFGGVLNKCGYEGGR